MHPNINRNPLLKWPDHGSLGNHSIESNSLNFRLNFQNQHFSNPNKFNPYFADMMRSSSPNLYPPILMSQFSAQMPPTNFPRQLLISPPCLQPTSEISKASLVPATASSANIPVSFSDNFNSNSNVPPMVPILPSTTQNLNLNSAISVLNKSNFSTTIAIDSNIDDIAWLNLLNPTQRAMLDNLKFQQIEFEKQYQNWLQEFDNWRKNNTDHSENESYKAYSNQWEQWKEKLLAKREQMQKLFTQTLEQLKSQIHQQYQPISFVQPTFFSADLMPASISTLPQVSQEFKSSTSLIELEKLPISPSAKQQNLSSQQTSLSNKTENIPLPQTSPPSVSSHLSPEMVSSPPLPPSLQSLSQPQSQSSSFENKNISSSAHSESFLNLSSNSTELTSNKLSNLNNVLEQVTENNNLGDISSQNQNDLTKSESLELSKTQALSENLLKKNVLTSEAAQTIIYILKRRELIKTIEKLDLELAKRKQVEFLSKTASHDQKNKNETICLAFSESDTNESTVPLKEVLSEAGVKPFDYESVISQIKSIQDLKNSKSSILDSKSKFSSNPATPLFPSYSTSESTVKVYKATNDQPLVSQFSSFSNQSDSSLNHFYSQTMNTTEEFHQKNYNHLARRSFQKNNRMFLYNSRNDLSEYNVTDQELGDKKSPYRLGYVAKTIDYEHGSSSRILNPHDSSQRLLSNLNQYSSNFDEAFKFSNYNETNSKEAQFLKMSLTSGKVSLEDLIKPGTREFRPKQIAIILRGFPGSGKTFLAKCIKDKEVEFGGSAPRILSLDDYFMVEKDSYIKEETGRKIPSKEFVYEYEKEMEENYRASLLKALKKTIDDGYFSFIIIDAINQFISHFEDFYNYAIKKGFVVYICEMDCVDVNVCFKRNAHNRKLDDIISIAKLWEPTPRNTLQLDSFSFLKNFLNHESHSESKNENIDNEKKRKDQNDDSISKKITMSTDSSHSEEKDETFDSKKSLSRWERIEESEKNYDRLDNFKMKRKITMEDYLQLPDDYELREYKTGQKRVRWTDIEERKTQQRMRNLGFVVGQDWNRMMDPNHPEKALIRTKYF